MAWVATAVVVGSALYSGYSSYQSGKAAEKSNKLQGALSQEDYYRQAALTRDEGYRTKQQQVMDFIGAGVEIQGTPLLMMLETEKKAEAEAGYLEGTGDAMRGLYNAKGRIAANEGKAALISSIGSAAGTVAKA